MVALRFGEEDHEEGHKPLKPFGALVKFNLYAEAMYDFIWRDFCDWYLEAVKPTIREHPGQQQVLRTVLNATLRLLHPICPFVTESLWPHVQATGAAGMHGIRLPGRELLAVAAWPDIACAVDDAAAAETFDRLRTLIGAIRQIRSDHQVPPRREVCLYAPDEVRALVAEQHVAQGVAGRPRHRLAVCCRLAQRAQRGGSDSQLGMKQPPKLDRAHPRLRRDVDTFIRLTTDSRSPRAPNSSVGTQK